jgi:hypothetical protein
LLFTQAREQLFPTVKFLAQRAEDMVFHVHGWLP